MNMRVIYLGHSGFLMEWEDIYCLFDYYKGEIPETVQEKPLYVFVSHAHGDHYNRDIWKLRKKHPQVQFIVSRDIPLSAQQRLKLGLSEEDEKRIIKVKADEIYRLPEDMTVKTLRSTDAGVAFLISHAGKTVFHAGDLNLWIWEEESAQYNADMEQRFLKEMEKLKGVSIDVAFFPLDPRQGGDCGKGLEVFNRTADVKALFPMHFWEKYDTIPQYIAVHPSEAGHIPVIKYEGQVFEI